MALFSCSPGLAPALRLDAFSNGEGMTRTSSSFSGRNIQLDALHDARSTQAVGNYSGSSMPPATDVLEAVTSRIRERLEQSGASIQRGNSLTLRIDLLEWFVEVKSSLPSAQASARAKIKVELHDAGRKLYGASYVGEQADTRPFLSQPRIETALALSLDYAIDQMLIDPRLQAALMSR